NGPVSTTDYWLSSADKARPGLAGRSAIIVSVIGQSIVGRLWSVVRCPWSVVRCPWSVVCCPWSSVVRGPWSVFGLTTPGVRRYNKTFVCLKPGVVMPPQNLPEFRFSEDALKLRQFVYEHWCTHGHGPNLRAAHEATGLSRERLIEA